MANVARHDLELKAGPERLRACQLPGDLRQASVYFAANAERWNVDSAVEKATEFKRGAIQAIDTVSIVAKTRLEHARGPERLFG